MAVSVVANLMMSHTVRGTKTKKMKFVEGSEPKNEKTKNL